MMNRSSIIAISGYKGSGKDEVAKMLQYCLNVSPIFRNYWCYKNFNWIGIGEWEIHRFADPIKEMLAVLLGVDVERFEDRDFKENYYIDFQTLQLHYVTVTPNDKILPDNKFTKLAKGLNPTLIEDYWLSVRQTMQYFGTECCRTFLGDKIWILSTFKRLANHAIISDLRFRVELDVAKHHDAKVIYVSRPGCKPGAHASERELQSIYENKEYDFLIENDGSLKDLFNQVKDLSLLWQE